MMMSMVTVMSAVVPAVMTMVASICPYGAGGKRTKQRKGYAHQFRFFHINLRLVVMAMFSCRKSLLEPGINFPGIAIDITHQYEIGCRIATAIRNIFWLDLAAFICLQIASPHV
jgi:hypothetical protein